MDVSKIYSHPVGITVISGNVVKIIGGVWVHFREFQVAP